MQSEILLGPDSISTQAINTFQPARLHMPGVSTEALLDSMTLHGGCFFVMTDGGRFPGHSPEALDDFFSGLDEVELEWRSGPNAWKLPCRVCGFSLDEEGVAAYVLLSFIDTDPRAHQALESFKASLW